MCKDMRCAAVCRYARVEVVDVAVNRGGAPGYITLKDKSQKPKKKRDSIPFVNVGGKNVYFHTWQSESEDVG